MFFNEDFILSYFRYRVKGRHGERMEVAISFEKFRMKKKKTEGGTLKDCLRLVGIFNPKSSLQVTLWV
jgi:hypothetical protein